MSPAAAGRLEREDPFNLGGFFPRSASILDETDECSWIRSGYDENPSAYSASMSQKGDEEEGTPGAVKPSTSNLIRGEDKMGVLSITAGRLFLKNNYQVGRPADDRLFSPYSDEEPVDHDSLYQTLAKRRDMHIKVGASASAQFRELFLPGEAEETAYSGSFVYGAMG